MKDQLFLLKNTMNQVLRGKEDIIRKGFAAVFFMPVKSGYKVLSERFCVVIDNF